MKKRPAAITALLLALALSSCAGGVPAADTTTAVTEKSAANTDITEVTEEMNSEIEKEPEIPVISEDFSGEGPKASKRGSASVGTEDDSAAAGKRALHITGRREGWNGAEYKAELFRGNEIEVKGSFRSSNAAVRVSIQFGVGGHTTYNTVFSVNTNDSTYTSGSGKYTVPANAENIMIYIESDTLDDIWVESFSAEVCGEYTYYAEPAATVYADTSDYPSLREAYDGLFRMGVAVSPATIGKPEYSELIRTQFNSVTAENDMKPEALLDRGTCLSDPEKYAEAPALKFSHLKTELDFARDNGMTVRGHTLVWHSQTPEWLFYKDYDKNGELADRELMLRRMENYIKSVMEWTDENYPGLISAWDVVNEAAADEGGMRQSLWYRTIGEDYIQKAFEYARRYVPEGVKLFYNDYNSYQKQKQSDILEFLRPVAEAGNIDGMGMQSHIGTYMSINEYMLALKKYHDELGVEIQITELDIGADNSDNWEEKQGKFFGKFMKRVIALRNEGVPITGVTLWGISDSLSWKASDRPLVFRDDLTRKPAFDAMIEAVTTND